MNISEKTVEKLKNLASKFCASADDENFFADDYAGGNIDDAYSRGVDDGEISLARDILTELGVEYKIED